MSIEIGTRIRSLDTNEFFSTNGWLGTVVEGNDRSLEYIEPGEFIVEYEESGGDQFYERFDNEDILWERVTDA